MFNFEFQCRYNKFRLKERNGINIDLIYFYKNRFEFLFDQLGWLETDLTKMLKIMINARDISELLFINRLINC